MPLQICGLRLSFPICGLQLGFQCLLAILFLVSTRISHVLFSSKFCLLFFSSLLLPITSKRNESQNYQTKTCTASFHPSINLTVTIPFLCSVLLSLGLLFKANSFTHAMNPTPFYLSRDLILSAITFSCFFNFSFFSASFSNNNQNILLYFTTIFLKKTYLGEKLSSFSHCVKIPVSSLELLFPSS